MRQYKISKFEIMNFLNDSPDPTFPAFKKLVIDRLVQKGFDINKPITEYPDLECDYIIYEQED
jgi:hypothetical protein